VCSSATTAAAGSHNTRRSSTPLLADVEDKEEEGFAGAAAAAAVRVVLPDYKGWWAPLTHLFYSSTSRCLASAHPASTVEEIESYYCPSCLSYLAEAEAAAAAHRCPRCFDCPRCPPGGAAALVVVPVGGGGQAGWELRCGFCGWASSAELGLVEEDPEYVGMTLSVAERESREEGRVRFVLLVCFVGLLCWRVRVVFFCCWTCLLCVVCWGGWGGGGVHVFRTSGTFSLSLIRLDRRSKHNNNNNKPPSSNTSSGRCGARRWSARESGSWGGWASVFPTASGAGEGNFSSISSSICKGGSSRSSSSSGKGAGGAWRIWSGGRRR
jgi:hypothetical protein